MAKREFIDKKAFIDRSAIEFVSLKDSFRYMEWSKNNEVQLEMIATTTTEQEIVKSYLENIRAEIEEVYINITYQENRKATWGLRKAMQIIDKYISKSEDKDGNNNQHN